jgi:hypothetical protein
MDFQWQNRLENLPWIYPEYLVEAQIIELLKKSYFTKVIYNGPLYMIAFGDRPRIYMGFDANFYDEENNTWDSPREYLIGSPTRNIIEEIISIFIDHGEVEGCEIWLEDNV